MPAIAAVILPAIQEAEKGARCSDDATASRRFDRCRTGEAFGKRDLSRKSTLVSGVRCASGRPSNRRSWIKNRRQMSSFEVAPSRPASPSRIRELSQIVRTGIS